jgi:hypothetical protein
MKRSINYGLILLSMLTALSFGMAYGENDTTSANVMPSDIISSKHIDDAELNPNASDGADVADVDSAIIESVTYGKTNQWVEIKNNETSAQDSTGWTLEVQNRTVFDFPKFILDVNAKVKVHSGAGNNNKTDLYALATILTKADDEVSLLDATGKVISTSEESSEASESPNDA